MMRILWLCNAILPNIAIDMGIKTQPFGGWLTGLSTDLEGQRDIQLFVLFPYKKEKNVKGNIGRLFYCSFFAGNEEKCFHEVITKFNPDIIHVFGTEYGHSLKMVNVCDKLGCLDKTVISIQGLVSICAKHFYCMLPQSVIHYWTIRDIARWDNIRVSRDRFVLLGKLEETAIRKIHNIIGRTDWDKACTQRINGAARYFACNETLRSSFYKNSWDFDRIERCSIFVSQCSYPIKGFHLMLEALSDVLKYYPNAHLYTTGKNPLEKSIISRLKNSSYARYLGKIIKKRKLQDHVTFLGILNEEDMCKRFLKSHVFVSCSSIENSPNSVGEAMLLGTPVVSSDVGGVKNMIVHETEGYLYPFDEPYMLAYYIMKIFADDKRALDISKNARRHASETHNRDRNLKSILSVYQDILCGRKGN